MKPTTIARIGDQFARRRIWLALFFVVSATLSSPPGSAQTSPTRHIVSRRVNDAAEGAKVIVGADLSVSRGDRFYLNFPIAVFQSANQAIQLKWKLLAAIAAALVLLLLSLALFRNRKTDKRRKLSLRSEKIRPGYLENVVEEHVQPLDEGIVRVDPALPYVEVIEPVTPVAIQTIRTNHDLELPLSAPSVSQSPEVVDPAVEPFSRSPAEFERTDLELKKLLSGGEFDADLIDASDSPTRQVVAASLIAALAGRNFAEHDHARRAFVNYGFFDETTKDLQTADSSAARAAAARKLGVVGDERATSHLVAALYDLAPEVRRASVESLGQIGDGRALGPLNELLQRENSRQLPEAVIRHAINSITVSEVKRTSSLEKPALGIAGGQPEPPVKSPSNEASIVFIDAIKQAELELTKNGPAAQSLDPSPPSVLSKEEMELEAEALRQAAADFERRKREMESARERADEEPRLNLEAEALMRAEEEARRRAQEEALQRKAVGEALIRAEEDAQTKEEADTRARAEEEARFKLEAEALRRAAEELARKRAEAESARNLIEEEARRRVEGEIRTRAEEARLSVEAEAKLEPEAGLSNQVQVELRLRAGEQARRIAEEEAKRRAGEAVRQQAEEESRKKLEAEASTGGEEETGRWGVDDRRLAEPDILRRSQAEGLLKEAEDRRRSEDHRLQEERLEAQQQTIEDYERKAETIQLKAEEQAHLIADAQERIRAEEEAGRVAEEQRQRFEAEAAAGAEERRRVEEQRLRAKQRIHAEEEARKRVEEERQRFEAEAEERAQELRRLEQERQGALEELQQREIAARMKTEVETRLLAEAQERLQAEEEARKQAEEQRQRLEVEAAARAEQRTGERKRAEELLQRAEAERRLIESDAERLAQEEEQLLADLEAARKHAEARVRQRAEIEQRIKAEIDALRRAEEEQRVRIVAESKRRVAAEAKLREAKARYHEEEEARIQVEREASLAEEARHRAEAEARRRIEDEAGARVERESIRLADENARRREEEEQRQLAEREARLRAEEAAQRLAEEEIRFKAEEKARLHEEDSSSTVECAGALTDLARLGGDDAFRLISKAFDDQSLDVRNAAAHALYHLQPDRAASFTRALREGTPERRRNIGASLASSGLAGDAIANLTGESREKTYDAFSLLFLMAKAGEVQPLLKAIEDYPSVDVRLAVVKLLALSGQSEIVPAFRRLAVRGSLPSEVRSAVMEAIYQISSQNRDAQPTGGVNRAFVNS